MKEMKLMEFKHGTGSFFEAVGISDIELAELLAGWYDFDVLPLEKKIRVISCFAYLVILAQITKGHRLGVIFVLLFSENSNHSENVEKIERNLVEYLNTDPSRLERIWRMVLQLAREEIGGDLQGWLEVVKS